MGNAESIDSPNGCTIKSNFNVDEWSHEDYRKFISFQYGGDNFDHGALESYLMSCSFSEIVSANTSFIWLKMPKNDWKKIQETWQKVIRFTEIENESLKRFQIGNLNNTLKQLGFASEIGEYRKGDCGPGAISQYLQLSNSQSVSIKDIRLEYRKFVCEFDSICSDDIKRCVVSSILGTLPSAQDVYRTAVEKSGVNDIEFHDCIELTEEECDSDNLLPHGALYCDGRYLICVAALFEKGLIAERSANIFDRLQYVSINDLLRYKFTDCVAPEKFYLVHYNGKDVSLCFQSSSSSDVVDFEPDEPVVASGNCSPQRKRMLSEVSGKWTPKCTLTINYQNETTMRHVMKNIVYLIAEVYFAEVLEWKFSDNQHFQYPLPTSTEQKTENLVLLISPTQNGKTNSMLRICWLSFFFYGFGTLYFIRSAAEEYTAISEAVLNFNNQLSTWLEEASQSPKYRHIFDGGGYEPEHYQIHCYTQLQFNAQQMQEDHYFRNADKKSLRCAMRVKILVPSNICTILNHTNEQKMMCNAYGVNDLPSGGHAFNITLIMDESQNSFAGATNQVLRESLPIKWSNFLPRRHCSSSSSFLSSFAVVLEVTATPEASISYNRREKKPLILQLNPDRDYYGYVTNLSPDHQIQPQSLEQYLDKAEYSFSLLKGEELLQEVGNGVLKAFRVSHHHERFHTLAIVQTKSNEVLIDYAKSILTHPELAQTTRPFIIAVAIGCNNGFGSVILCNAVAAESFERHLIDADRELYISKDDICDTPMKRPKNNQKIQEAPGVHTTYITTRLNSTSLRMERTAENVLVIRLPAKANYRIRTQISLIKKVIEKGGLKHYFLLTLGDRLIKEGIVVNINFP